MVKLKEKIDSRIQDILTKISSRNKIEDLYAETQNIIINLFYYYFFLSPDSNIIMGRNIYGKFGNLKYKISDPTKDNIEEFVKQYFKEAINIYKNKIKEFDHYSKDLKNEIFTFQNDYNKQNDNLLEYKWTSNELEEILKGYIVKNISNTIELNVLKNSFSYIVSLLTEQFKEFFLRTCFEVMKTDQFKEKTDEIMQISFDEIEKKIIRYNELNKKKKENEIKEKSEDPAPTNVSNAKENIKNIVANLVKIKFPKKCENINKEDIFRFYIYILHFYFEFRILKIGKIQI